MAVSKQHNNTAYVDFETLFNFAKTFRLPIISQLGSKNAAKKKNCGLILQIRDFACERIQKSCSELALKGWVGLHNIKRPQNKSEEGKILTGKLYIISVSF